MLVASAGAAPPVAPVDLRWARAIRDAVLLAMSAELARTAMPFIAYALYPLSSSGSGLYLYYSIVCVWWTLAWYAALKLTKSEVGDRPPFSTQMVTWALRVMATLYLALPFVAVIVVEQPTWRGPTTLHVIARASAMLASALYFFRVRDVCRRLGGMAPAGQAALVALILPFSVWGSRAWSNWRGGSLLPAPFANLPSYQLGDTAQLRSFVYSFPNDVGAAMMVAPNLALALGCWVVMVRLLILSWRAGRA